MSCLFNIGVADLTFRVCASHSSTMEYCKKFLIEQEGEIAINITPEDVDRYRQTLLENPDEELNARTASNKYLESLYLLKCLADLIPLHNAMLMHGSAICVDGNGYIFTALSGTGKSTHTRLLRKLLGDRAYMVNDDKPFILFREDGIYVCGTPWMGKHELGENAIVPLKGIFFLRRSEENVYEAMEPAAALSLLMNQCYRPDDIGAVLSTMDMMDKLLSSVSLYDFGCNMDISAAELSSSLMK